MPFERSITLTPSEHGLPEGWSPARFHDELERAAASFGQPAVPCSSVRLTVAAPTRLRIAAEDGTSLVVFRSEQWCHNSICGHLDTFPLRAMAMTETHPHTALGAAVAEADIELNAAHFRFTEAAVPVNPEVRVVPLRAVLLHELGHVLGLEDRCVPEAQRGIHGAAPELDRCKPGEAESIMFAPALNLTPSALDVAALCRAHPASGASSNGASMNPSGSRGPKSIEESVVGNVLPALVLLLALGVLLTRFARRSVAQRTRKLAACRTRHAVDQRSEPAPGGRQFE